MTYLFAAGLAACFAGIALFSVPTSLIVGGATVAALAFLYERGSE